MLQTFLPNHWPTLKLEKNQLVKNDAWKVLPIIIYANNINNIPHLHIEIPEHISSALPLVIIQEHALSLHIIITCANQNPLTLWTLNYNNAKDFSLYVHARAKITHIVWQQIKTNYRIFIGQEAQCISYLYPFNQGSMAYNVFLQEPFGNSKVFSLGYAANDFCLATTILVTHQAPNTISYVLSKNLANHQALVTVTAGITIEKNATTSTASLEIKNIMLAQEACIKAIPQLAIYTQEVDCKHANSIGSFNGSWLFYLQSRGIPLDTAYFLLLQGFVQTMIFPEPKLQQYLFQQLSLPE